MNEPNFEPQLRASIPGQCECLAVQMAVLAISRATQESGASLEAAQRVFDELLAPDCPGMVENPNSRGGCMPEKLCGHPKGPRFLMDSIARSGIAQLKESQS